MDRPINHLNQVQLGRRWCMSHRTLERWRWEGKGPRYLKVGGRVLYRLTDIEAFERNGLSTPDEAKPFAQWLGEQRP
jgi:hypothetical protein